MTIDEVKEAYHAFAREHGIPAAKQIVNRYGGVSGDYRTVAQDKWAQLVAAFGRNVERHRRMSAQEVAEALATLHDSAYRTWNNPPMSRRQIPRIG